MAADNLSFFFLAEGEQTAASVMTRLTDFIAGAQRTLDFAIYDMRLGDALKSQFAAALKSRADAGVQIRFIYDGDKPLDPNLAAGQDPASPGTGVQVQSLGYPWRRIAGMKLMHQKFIVRDSAAVWTGSLNLTDDAFTLMENNVVMIDSATIASYYNRDFEEIWERSNFENTGAITTVATELSFHDAAASLRVMFSPGCGLEIDAEIARRVSAAQRRIRICSLLLNSGTLLDALLRLLRAGRIAMDGIYDRTQMADVYRQWQTVPSNRWKIPAVEEIVQRARLAGKNSTPYSPTGRHDFMHNKVLLIDDTVITGSYNFSRSAQYNAENILFIDSAATAQLYSNYIDHLLTKYSGRTAPAL